MGFTDSVKQGFEIIKLNESAMQDVARDSQATPMGILFLAIAGVASAIGTLTFIFFLPLLLYTILTILGTVVGVFLIHLLAKLFGGKGSYSSLFRVASHASILSWITIIPILGPLLGTLIGIWLLVVWTISIRTLHKLPTKKAVIVVLLFIGVILLLSFLLSFLAILTYLGLGSPETSTGSVDALDLLF